MKVKINKNSHDNNLIKLSITVKNEYITIFQDSYIEDIDLISNSKLISDFLKYNQNECFVTFGKIDINYTPAFSIFFKKIDELGHFQLEFDCEICDDTNRGHRAKFFVTFEFGELENLAKGLLDLSIQNYFKEINI